MTRNDIFLLYSIQFVVKTNSLIQFEWSGIKFFRGKLYTNYYNNQLSNKCDATWIKEFLMNSHAYIRHIQINTTKNHIIIIFCLRISEIKMIMLCLMQIRLEYFSHIRWIHLLQIILIVLLLWNKTKTKISYVVHGCHIHLFYMGKKNFESTCIKMILDNEYFGKKSVEWMVCHCYCRYNLEHFKYHI